MSLHPDLVHDDTGTWNADHVAVWVEVISRPDTSPVSTMLRHPDYPFMGSTTTANLDVGLRGVANDYITAVQKRARIAPAIVSALVNDDWVDFGWLPLRWGKGALPGNGDDPRGSFQVARRQGDVLHDQTVVLLGAYRVRGKQFSAGGEIGLRVVMHVGAGPAAGQLIVRVTGMSSSALPVDFGAVSTTELSALDVNELSDRLGQSLGVDFVSLQGLAWVNPSRSKALRLVATTGRSVDPAQRSREPVRSFKVVTHHAASDSEPQLIARVERVSHADPRTFDRDAASTGAIASITNRRPTRKTSALDALRVNTMRLPSNLKDASGFEEVRQSRLHSLSADPDEVQTIALQSPLPLRSDALAAGHAFQRGNELFERLQAYGLGPNHYFKLARLPLLLRHRAPLKGCSDGIAVNAQVLPDRLGPQIDEPMVARDGTDLRPQIEVSFGWAELWHRRWLPNDVGRVRAQPLGLAADRRWAWHEFGHVLNFASIGELEFRFAHSAGDALAAIVCDPDSALAADPWARHLSFPWVFIPRRHDRPVERGWCWCGRRNRPRLAQAEPGAARGQRLGYFEEQLMSSSLFRLYRCAGGDSFAPNLRRGASDYVVYLIMRAIALLGPESVVPARSADQFVSALCDADIGTGDWQVNATWPESEAPRSVMPRVGGCLHKVIRWAFEQQGLYATENAGEVAEGIGQPPPVDIFIEDGRPGGNGGYAPVPLDAVGSSPPLWHASSAAMRVDSGDVVVTVGNRGSFDAPQVRVKCWVMPGQQAADEPTAWLPLDEAGPQPRAVAAGPTAAPTEFRFKAVLNGTPLSGDYCVKAAASSAEDRSNIDPLSGLPSAQGSVPVADLVANDNNLALRVMHF